MSDTRPNCTGCGKPCTGLSFTRGYLESGRDEPWCEGCANDMPREKYAYIQPVGKLWSGS
jgi:hypothetical protein